jgi:hypothetical protein
MPAKAFLIRIYVVCAAILSTSAGGADKAFADAEETAAAAQTAVAQMTPYDVGSRYGQALGAVEICPGMMTTLKVPALHTLYTGANLQTFKAQATKIYDAWVKLKQCALVDDPNQCRMVVDESCAAAIGEIGPSGSVLPGLLEGPQH